MVGRTESRREVKSKMANCQNDYYCHCCRDALISPILMFLEGEKAIFELPNKCPHCLYSTDHDCDEHTPYICKKV